MTACAVRRDVERRAACRRRRAGSAVTLRTVLPHASLRREADLVERGASPRRRARAGTKWNWTFCRVVTWPKPREYSSPTSASASSCAAREDALRDLHAQHVHVRLPLAVGAAARGERRGTGRAVISPRSNCCRRVDEIVDVAPGRKKRSCFGLACPCRSSVASAEAPRSSGILRILDRKTVQYVTQTCLFKRLFADLADLAARFHEVDPGAAHVCESRRGACPCGPCACNRRTPRARDRRRPAS